MKKKIINIIPVFLITIAIILISCEKIEESSPITINTTNTAKLSGMAFVDLVLDKVYIQDQNYLNPNYSFMNLSDTLEYAPEGTEIHFRVLKTAYNPKAPTGEMLRFVTTVNANGAYSIDIPTTTEGVDVNISFDEFTASKLTWKYDSTSINVFGNWLKDWYSSSTEVKTYLKTPATNTLHTGENKFLDFTYN
jgi:hypothetical protein